MKGSLPFIGKVYLVSDIVFMISESNEYMKHLEPNHSSRVIWGALTYTVLQGNVCCIKAAHSFE